MFLLLLSAAQAQDEVLFEPYAAEPYDTIFTPAATGLVELSHGNLNQTVNGSDPTTDEAWLGRDDVIFFVDTEQVSLRCDTGWATCAEVGISDTHSVGNSSTLRPLFDGDLRYAANAYAVLTHAIDTYYSVYSNVDFTQIDSDHALTVWVGPDSNNGGPTSCGGSCMRPEPGNSLSTMVGALPGAGFKDVTSPGLYFNRPFIQLSDDYMDGSGRPRKLAHTMVHEYGHYYNRVIALEYTDGGIEYASRDSDTVALGEGLGYWWSSDWEGVEYLSRFWDMDEDPTWAEWGEPDTWDEKGQYDEHQWGEVLTDAMWETREICAAGSDRVHTDPMSYAVFDLVDGHRDDPWASKTHRLDSFRLSDPFEGGTSDIRGFAWELYTELEEIGFCSGDELAEVAALYRQRGLFPHTIQEHAGNVSQPLDNLGRAVATGDFNGDGHIDVAASAPYNSGHRGAVWVFFGPRALDWSDFETLTQSDAGGTVEDDDRFGTALAVGDFNGDGTDDLAVGSPGEDGASTDEGVVHVFYGGSTAFTATLELDQDILGSTRERYDLFGRSLTAGDFDGDGIDELAIGSPGETLGSASMAGYIHIVPGAKKTGLDLSKARGFSQTTLGSTSEPNDNLGQALASGDFDGDGYDDLAMAGPGETLNGKGDAGTVWVLNGDEDGLDKNQRQRLDQDDFGSPIEDDDSFGWTLAVGDFNGDDKDDLAIGSPFESSYDFDAIGQVHVAYGSSASLKPDTTLDQVDASGRYEESDWFGLGLSTGDVDGDGLDDLLIGAIGEGAEYTGEEDDGTPVTLRTFDAAGAVHVFYGQTTPLTSTATWVDAETFGTKLSDDAWFGYALATGDLDQDGLDDVVVGVPGHEVDGAIWAGQFVTGRIEP